MYQNFGQFINGEWRQGSGEEPVIVTDPGNGQSLGEIAAASAADTQSALASAEAALVAWRTTSGWARADLLQAVAKEMTVLAAEAAQIISKESGKPLAQARREWELSTDQFI